MVSLIVNGACHEIDAARCGYYLSGILVRAAERLGADADALRRAAVS